MTCWETVISTTSKRNASKGSSGSDSVKPWTFYPATPHKERRLAGGVALRAGEMVELRKYLPGKYGDPSSILCTCAGEAEAGGSLDLAGQLA